MGVGTMLRRPVLVAVAWILAAAGIAVGGTFAYVSVQRGNESAQLDDRVAQLKAASEDLASRLDEAAAASERFEAEARALEERLSELRRLNRELERRLESALASGVLCSAFGLPPPEPRTLPGPVTAIRRAIVRAATACDYDRLEALALGGSSGIEFAYSFDPAVPPGTQWRESEERGDEPLRHLVELLDRPFRKRVDDGIERYVWPSAAAYDDWASVPQADREALGPLYGDEDFALFEDVGAYIGYRIHITGRIQGCRPAPAACAGDWIIFIAGD